MRDFDDSTLWRISEFERVRITTGTSGFVSLARDTVLGPTLLADLNSVQGLDGSADVIELLAAILRHRDPVVVYFRNEGLIWPITFFPVEGVYHSPRDVVEAGERGLSGLQAGLVEPAGLRAPGHVKSERVGRADCYHPLAPALWAIALKGPSQRLAVEIGGVAAYRTLRRPSVDGLTAPGALGPALQQLQGSAVSLAQIVRWPGMSLERGNRLLNALYLTSNLLVSRTHPNARRPPGARDALGGR